MINTRLVMALEELFKKEPFDLENDEFIISASRGRISVEEYKYMGTYGDYDDLLNEVEFYSSINYDLNDNISYYKRRCERLEQKLEDNDIDFE